VKQTVCDKVVPYFMPCWKTMIKIPEEIVERAFELGEGLEREYEDFSFKITTSYKPDIRNEQRCKLMVVYSPTKDLAHIRGTKIMYGLKLKDFPQIEAPWYSVKEYPSNLHAGEGDNIHVLPVYEELVNRVKNIFGSNL
jgi:hypothetical protein